MFFMGSTNAIFVALSVPAFIVFYCLSCLCPAIGFTLNMIVLFSFLLALGIVVDDAIVVIENTHRIFANGKVPIKQAAKIAAGESIHACIFRYYDHPGAICSTGLLEQFDWTFYVLPADNAYNYTACIISGCLYHESGFRG